MITVALYDTNIIISGLFWRGIPRQLMLLAQSGKIEIVTCQALLDELKALLMRSKKSFAVTTQEADRVIDEMLKFIKLVTPTHVINICRDPDDNLVLACAAEGHAIYIVTDDLDLLTLGEFEGIKIVTARQFFEVVHD
jgi:putative PIN family toxin of toxin-antitoxin system